MMWCHCYWRSYLVGDTVNIMVYGEPEMTMKFIIDKSGAITFPYIGKLMLKGKTAEQVVNKLPRSYVGIICKPNGYRQHRRIS